MTEVKLFKEEKLRDVRGRFCTKDAFKWSRIDAENKRLRYENEKYFRAWQSTSQRCIRAERELKSLKDKIKELV